MVVGLKEPHLFNAGSNPMRTIRNLEGILSAAELDKLRQEVVANVIGLFRLGEAHYNFAQTLPTAQWRQRVSRFYYGAYNIRRAVALKHDGSFSTDSSDHKNVHNIPDSLANVSIYKSKLVNLRDDRNLADYNHLAIEGDLLIPLAECEILVADFVRDAKAYLIAEGVTL